MERYKEAKVPLSPLAGPYGHPIHPLAVTLPIGAWTASFLFDLVGTRSEDEWAYAIGAKRLIDIGIAGGTLAGAFGLMDFLRIPPRTKAWYTGLTHLALNVSAIGLFALNSASRGRHLRGRDPGAAVTSWQRTMSAATVTALVVSGWLGGSLTYRYGVRVADEREQQAAGYSGDSTAEEYVTRSTFAPEHPKS